MRKGYYRRIDMRNIRNLKTFGIIKNLDISDKFLTELAYKDFDHRVSLGENIDIGVQKWYDDMMENRHKLLPHIYD